MIRDKDQHSSPKQIISRRIVPLGHSYTRRGNNSFAPLSKYCIECYSYNNFGHMAQNYPAKSLEGFWKKKQEEPPTEKFRLAMYTQNNQSH